ncbi:GIN domain-containing protein, partial [Sphingomonas sp.]|uniref:GIN domain-containing protein n=1 Tax=Sphingomonas sp. TaxID=28214 RepID=UPI002B5F14CD
MVRPLLILVSAVVALGAAPARADERSYMLTGFERIRVEGPFDVEVTTGASAAARAEADVRALDTVSLRVNGTTLVVSPGTGGWGGFPDAKASAPTVRVTVPMLQAVTVSGGGRLSVTRMRSQRIDLFLTGSGAIDVAEINADQLNVNLVGTGRVTLAGQAHVARVQTNGAGAIEATGMAADTLTVSGQSAGDASFTARTSATVAALGSGTIRI